MVQALTLTTFILFATVALSSVDALATRSSRRAFLNEAKITAAGFVAALTPNVVHAYERRDVGEEGSRSAATAAFNEQAYKTNNRLESEGFKLDTREEEKAKLSAAMASFSYESTTSTKKKTGYGSIASKSSSSSSRN